MRRRDDIGQRRRLFGRMRVGHDDAGQTNAARPHAQQHIIAARNIIVIQANRTGPRFIDLRRQRFRQRLVIQRHN